MISPFISGILATCLGFYQSNVVHSPDRIAQYTQSQDAIIFPTEFLKGVARSCYQDGGHGTWQEYQKPYSNWSAFEDSRIYGNARGVSLTLHSPILHGQKVGKSSHGWERAFDDIALLHELGCNAQRFSVEWTDIEPEEGQFNEEALAFYERYCEALVAQGITPMVTLHHFVHPQWFQDKGGFERSENIAYFVRFSQKVFKRLASNVTLWCTINEPTVLSACGYVLGIHPPGYVGKTQRAGLVLKNLLQAHIEVYSALKAMPRGEEAQIGLVHQMLCFEPYHYFVNKTLHVKNPIGTMVSHIFNYSFAHAPVKYFLETGKFSFFGVEYVDARAPHSYDFIGLNFYSKVVIGFGPTQYEGQIKTDMDYAIRPDLLYDALKEMADLGKPIYVTETGLADAKDTNRAFCITSYMRAIDRALKNGIPVKGVFYWSLIDNFEWNDGFDMKFGLYAVDPISKERTLREGSKAYRDILVSQR